jgi:cytochrome c biogenesis protein CcmG/thiol:disulfide interchange protein DsbE|tara:strand:+ start:2300 stop:2815 length:516 start_codon:yes stop_codon:yes gene_type:complete
MQKTIKIVISIIFLFVIGVFFIGLNKDTNYNTNSLIGKKIPNINLEYFDENKFYKGDDLKKNNYTLINFWASWCAPCRDEHPLLIQLSEEKNLKLLGVNFKDKKKQADKFLNDLGNPYDFLTKDDQGRNSVNFGIYGIPESILVNKDLIILKKFVGPLSVEDFNSIIEIIN